MGFTVAVTHDNGQWLLRLRKVAAILLPFDRFLPKSRASRLRRTRLTDDAVLPIPMGSGETYITSADLINSCLIYYVCQGLVDYAAAGGSAALPTTESQGQAPDPFDWVDTNLFDVPSKSG